MSCQSLSRGSVIPSEMSLLLSFLWVIKSFLWVIKATLLSSCSSLLCMSPCLCVFSPVCLLSLLWECWSLLGFQAEGAVLTLVAVLLTFLSLLWGEMSWLLYPRGPAAPSPSCSPSCIFDLLHLIWKENFFTWQIVVRNSTMHMSSHPARIAWDFWEFGKWS